MLFQEFIVNISNPSNEWISNTSDKNQIKDELKEVNKLLEKVR